MRICRYRLPNRFLMDVVKRTVTESAIEKYPHLEHYDSLQREEWKVGSMAFIRIEIHDGFNALRLPALSIIDGQRRFNLFRIRQ